MTRKEVKNLLLILQAFAEGKTIQVKGGNGIWYDGGNDLKFDLDPQDYRIQLEPKYRPFKDSEECWEEMHKHQPFGWIKNSYGHFEITGIKKEGVCFGVANNFHGYEYLFTDYLFADGTSFGMKKDGTKTE